jgi:hypothetical protein
MKICRHEKVECAASIGARCEARRDCCSGAVVPPSNREFTQRGVRKGTSANYY